MAAFPFPRHRPHDDVADHGDWQTNERSPDETWRQTRPSPCEIPLRDAHDRMPPLSRLHECVCQDGTRRPTETAPREIEEANALPTNAATTFWRNNQAAAIATTVRSGMIGRNSRRRPARTPPRFRGGWHECAQACSNLTDSSFQGRKHRAQPTTVGAAVKPPCFSTRRSASAIWRFSLPAASRNR